MSQIICRRVQNYVSENPDTRRKLVSVLDAFDYVDDRQDTAMLTRLLNRMVLSPRLASAICALGVGYEEAINALPPNEIPAYNATIRSVGRVAAKSDDDLDVLRVWVTTDVDHDEEIENLVRIASMSRTQCAATNNRFRGYKCDVPKEVGVEQCGLNTNFTCEKGVTSGVGNCDAGDGNRCRLSLIGKENKERTSGRKRVKAITNAARLAHLAG